MPAFGSSAKWLRGPVAGSASKKKANPGQGYDAPRKSFFQSLDPEERAALLKVAPSLRCARLPPPFRATLTTATTPPGTTFHIRALTASPAPTTPSRPRRDKFSDHEQVRTPGKRRVVVDSDDSDDSLANTPTSAHLSLRRGVLGSKPTPLSGGRSRSRILDSDEDVDDAPIARTPRSAAAKPKSSSKPAKSASPLASTRSASAASPRRAAPAPGEVPGEAAAQSPSHSPRVSASARTYDLGVTRDIAARESQLRFEVERLKRHNASLTAENDAVRAQMRAARRDRAATEGSLAMESRELDRLREKAIDEGAVRAAELEDQCERQRRMLQELAVASEALAKDNVLLSTELVSVRDRGDDAERRAAELTERLRSAQRLYLAGQRTLERAEETGGAGRGGEWERRMDALLTPETLSKSRPPASFPSAAPLASVENVAGGARKGVSGALMQERRRLDEENRSLRKALEKAERRARVAEESRMSAASDLAAARRDGGEHARKLRARLEGAARRLQWLVARVEKLDDEAKERDDYVASLERRLLAQHKTMDKMDKHARRGGAGTLSASASRGGANTDGARASGTGTATGSRSARARGVDSAVAFLKSGGKGGWVTGSDGRTPTARRAIGLARRARAAASPAPDRFARTVADASDSDRTDHEEDVEADPSDDASNEDGVRRMDFGDVGDAEEKTSEASGGAAEASEKSAERTSPGLGEDMSLEGIQQYISELQALHQKTGMALRTPNKRDARG